MYNNEMHALKRALAVCIFLQSEEENHAITRVDELASLAYTSGYDVASRCTLKQAMINAKTYISKGRLETIKANALEMGANCLIFDNELSASQIGSIEEDSDLIIRTRTDIILEIFQMRAKTKIAKMQVELAMLEFELPRLKGKWRHFSRLGGVRGVRGGAGEHQLEYDRRRARTKIHKLKVDLEKMQSTGATGRKSRSEAFRVAIVGYTNAGKSTLFNKLCKEQVYVEDKLFATLDTYTRKFYLGDTTPLEVLISDTVGFIDRLPHMLIESFKSTLAEVREANLLIHLVDASAINRDMHIERVNSVLEEIGAKSVNHILVFNKIDSLNEGDMDDIIKKYPIAILISAKSELNIALLKERVLKFINMH